MFDELLCFKVMKIIDQSIEIIVDLAMDQDNLDVFQEDGISPFPSFESAANEFSPAPLQSAVSSPMSVTSRSAAPPAKQVPLHSSVIPTHALSSKNPHNLSSKLLATTVGDVEVALKAAARLTQSDSLSLAAINQTTQPIKGVMRGLNAMDGQRVTESLLKREVSLDVVEGPTWLQAVETGNARDQSALQVADEAPPIEPMHCLNWEDTGPLAEVMPKAVATISPIRTTQGKRLKMELNRAENPEKQLTERGPKQLSKKSRIPTIEWMTERTKRLVDDAIVEEQNCALCGFKTSKRRIRIHVRQHFCMHFCHCGYQHVSRDQVAEHQKVNAQDDHRRELCSVYMVAEENFSDFLEYMQWPADMTFGPLLSHSQERKQVGKRLRDAGAKQIEGYRISNRVSTAEISEAGRSPSWTASTALSSGPLLSQIESNTTGDAWQTTSKPSSLVIKTEPHTNLEKPFEQQAPSERILCQRAAWADLLEKDAEGMENDARDVDDTMRHLDTDTPEYITLRIEADQLRAEASRLRTIASTFLNADNSDTSATREYVVERYEDN